MSGISTGVGFFSGVNSGQIIEQLLAIEARPRQQAQARILQMQLGQSAYLDLNSRLTALRTAAKVFREAKTFQTKSATSSDEDALTATATTGAAPGSYTFLVDRLVTTQQMLSRGFANKDSAAVGATGFTFESAIARLDRDVSLSDLNAGQGVSRGKIVVTDRAGGAATIDLSRTTSVQEVLDAINANGTARVQASVQGGRFVIKDLSGGGGSLSVADAAGYTTATSLGLAGSVAGATLSGTSVYAMSGSTTLASLNDGNGVSIRNVVGVGDVGASLRLVVTDAGANEQTLNVNLGDVYEEQTVDGQVKLVKTQGAVTTVQGVLDRVNQALAGAGMSAIVASVDAANGRIAISDTAGVNSVRVEEANNGTTARDLGLVVGAAAGSVTTRRVFAGLNTTLARGLHGGAGVAGDGVLNFTLRDGSTFSTTIDVTASLSDIFAQIESASGNRVRAGLDARGTGFTLTDTTTGATAFAVTGTTGSDTAASLGVTGAAAQGVISTGNLQRQYLSNATRLSTLNNGRGIGTGRFTITDGDGTVGVVNITDSTQTVAELLSAINGAGARVTARINSTGDGIEIIENTTGQPAGGVKIKIEDTSGTVAKSLNLAKTAAGTGASNTINGSYERTVTFSAADTLQQITDKINGAGAGVVASIVRDGNGSTPYRLSLSSASTGRSGRFLIDTGAIEMGLQTLEAGQDARAFFGSADAARAIAVTGSSNTVDEILPGVKIDLRRVSEAPVTVTVASDTGAITQAVNAFVSAFNNVVDRINTQTRYDAETKKGGPLLGDSTTIELRGALFTMVQSPTRNVAGRFSRLTDVGFKIEAGGRLSLNEDRFRQALAEDAGSVEAMFAARVQADDQFIDVPGVDGVRVRNPNAGSSFTSLGIMGQLEEMVTRYVDSTSGLLTGRGKAIADQIAVQQARIEAFDARLDRRRTQLQRQFASMETTIGRLQGQQGALSSLASLAGR